MIHPLDQRRKLVRLEALKHDRVALPRQKKALSVTVCIAALINWIYLKLAKPEPNRRAKTTLFLGRAGNFG